MNSSPFLTIRMALLACALFFLIPSTSSANSNSSGTKPQWVTKGEGILNAQCTNDTYYFKVIKTYGSNLSEAKQSGINSLADYIGKRNQISGLAVTEMASSDANGNLHEQENFRMTFKNEFSTSVFEAALVDDYWELVGNEYQYSALYAVSERGDGTSRFDRFEVTRSYGATPAVMSIIPGAGQLYKGQKMKGFLMLGGAAVGVAAIVLSENRRAYNETRIAEQPQFARTYSTRRDNWATSRNVVIGATAALMVWSVIDAATTPGATRIKVSPSTSVAFIPTSLYSPDGVTLGGSLSITF